MLYLIRSRDGVTSDKNIINSVVGSVFSYVVKSYTNN